MPWSVVLLLEKSNYYDLIRSGLLEKNGGKLGGVSFNTRGREFAC